LPFDSKADEDLKLRETIYVTYSDFETVSLGRTLGQILGPSDVLALKGELGSGKTWFVKGVALGVGVGQETVVTSPSFTLVNEYVGRCALYHIDLYRLEDERDILSAGLDEYFELEGVTAVEWADRCPRILPERSLWVQLRILDLETREIRLSGSHPRSVWIVGELETAMREQKGRNW